MSEVRATRFGDVHYFKKKKKKKKKNVFYDLNSHFVDRGAFYNTITQVILYSADVQGSWHFAIRSIKYLIFCHGLIWGGTGVPGDDPGCQLGIINPTDMSDGSDQQLTMATMWLRPSRLYHLAN